MANDLNLFLQKLCGAAAVLTAAIPHELLRAELMSVHSRKNTLEFQIFLDSYPDGETLSRAEEELEKLLSFKPVHLALRRSPYENQEDLLRESSFVLDWMLRRRRELNGTTSFSLAAACPRMVGDTLSLALPAYAREDMDVQVQEKVQYFFRRYAGIEPAPKLCIDDKEYQGENADDYLRRHLGGSHFTVDPDASSVDFFAGGTEQDSGSSPNGSGSQMRASAAPAPQARDSYPSSAQDEEAGSATTALPENKRRYRRKKMEGLLWGRMYELQTPASMAEIGPETGITQLAGSVHDYEATLIKSGKYMRCKFDLYGDDGAVACILFAKPEEEPELTKALKKAARIQVEAEISYDDRFSHDLQARVTGVMELPAKAQRSDTAAEKRVELHCHSKMSAQDSVSDASAIVELAARFGHPAVALTDHGVVQSFPEAYETVQKLKKNGQEIKLIFGMEGYLTDDGGHCVFAAAPFADEFDDFVALDVETTGLDCTSDRLIEVAALRFTRDADGKFVAGESFTRLINPGISLPEKISKLTGITDMDLISAGPAYPVIEELHAFMGDSPMVAHNALFDLGFLRSEAFRTPEKYAARPKFNPVTIDTLEMSRHFLPDLKGHRLDQTAEYLGIKLEQHHRAEDDARCCGEIFARLYERLGRPGLNEINERAGALSADTFMQRKHPTNHIIFLVRDDLGLYNLYRLVSESHTRYFSRRPRIPRSLLQYLRHGLILGSACEAGEVYRHVRRYYVENGKNLDRCLEQLKDGASRRLQRFYDYFEIQPLTNNRFLIQNPNTGILSDQDLMQINRLILAWGKQAKKPVVATCDSHFLDPEDAIYREIMLSNMGFTDSDRQAALYFRSTDEMLAEFAYLGEQQAREVVISAPLAIAEKISADLMPFPPGSYPPKIAIAEERVRELTLSRAAELYDMGQGLPELVAERIKKELDSIINNGFAIMYYIAHMLVKKSNDDGYMVGSRGSVGSSLVATLCGITEVNPLPPHYHCPSCRYSEFDTSGRFGSGFDLPRKNCPECGCELKRDGQDIPFETFLGFNGDKQPDIDLNFSGEYQGRAHLFIREMFGETHTYRAGTIGCYAEKNAEGLVRAYQEKRQNSSTRADVRRLSKGLIGVKRTTGQHPGGIVVIPKDREVYDFTPVQYPADKSEGNMQTTHFDFNAMHDTILKLDILGHDDPTMLKVLGDLTGVDVRTIPVPDEGVMSLFRGTEALNYVIPGDQEDATLGIPEMGTKMAREMIRETQPQYFFDLVQLSGLSHGTDVWKGNAQDLIREGICDINGVIGCRDGIMTTLIYKGLPKKAAFDIMEKVRKGKGLSAEHEALMREHQVEDWYIDSCKKIKYMFPKAHAVAYVLSALRIAWFKLYKPEAYYAAYYSVRADEFDSSLMCRGLEQTIINRENARAKMQQRDANPKDKSIFYILELVEEMHRRGIEFLPISLMESDASMFKVAGEKKILPPFNVIPGFSTAMGEALVEARRDGAFICRDEIMSRAHLGQAAIEALAAEGVLDGIPESSQIDLMEWFGNA